MLSSYHRLKERLSSRITAEWVDLVEKKRRKWKKTRKERNTFEKVMVSAFLWGNRTHKSPVFILNCTPLNPITKEFALDFIHANPLKLYPTQTKICLPILNRLYKKMQKGIVFPDIKVADNLIIDGHHRYLAAAFAKYEIERALSGTSTVTRMVDWHSVDFVYEDWDTSDVIALYHEQDAFYNKIPVAGLLELLK